MPPQFLAVMPSVFHQGGNSMRQTVTSLVAIALAATPAQAVSWNHQGGEIRSGAFVGARLNVPLGSAVRSTPRAGLALAPMQSRISRDGYVASRIGEGVALDLTHRKPTITLAGIRADRAPGLTVSDSAKVDEKRRISTGGWVAIGVGTVVVAGLIGFALWVDAIEDNSD
jgi:hypothetical protein